MKCSSECQCHASHTFANKECVHGFFFFLKILELSLATLETSTIYIAPSITVE